MKKIYPLLGLISLASLTISCKSEEHTFRKKDIKSSEKLIGLDFSKENIQSMHGYLERNKRGYDSLRAYEVSNETFPAVTFDPHPLGFQLPEAGLAPSFEIPEGIELPENLQELAFYPIPKLASLLKSKQISSVELTKLFIDRIKKYDGKLESVITLTEDLAMQQAQKADQEIAAGQYRGILHGIPYGVKDLMAVADYPTTWGAEPYKDQMIDYTATVVQKLEEQGAVLIAKLVSGSLARGDVWFGGKTKNPWDLTQGASGSSAGSGSATSAGLVPFALGTETLGSITSPATRNGVTGLRPTYGRVSRYGVMSLSWSMDKIGPLARNAEDCAIVLEAIYGKDWQDPSTNEVPFSFPTKDIKDFKVAYLKQDIESDSSEFGKNTWESLQVFQEMGVEMDSLELPENFPYSAFDIILRAEAGAFFDVLVRSGEVDEMVEQHGGSRAVSLRQARFIPAVEYLQANRQRRQLIEEVNKLFQEYDVIIAPTNRSRQLLLTNLTGHPVISIPNGLDENNRPTSFTLIGNLYGEGALVAFAKAYQDLTEFDEMHPPDFVD